MKIFCGTLCHYLSDTWESFTLTCPMCSKTQRFGTPVNVCTLFNLPHTTLYPYQSHPTKRIDIPA